MNLIVSLMTGGVDGVRQRLNNKTSDYKADFQNENGMTALMYATISGENDAVSFLLEQGADPNIQDKYGNTAIMYAAINKNKDAVPILRKYGASTKIKNKENWNYYDWCDVWEFDE